MKQWKQLPILCWLLVILSLTGCGKKETMLTGEVTKIISSGSTAQLLLHPEKGTSLCILADRNTILHSWLEGVKAETLLEGKLYRPMIRVYTTSRAGKTEIDGTTYKSYPADQILLYSVTEENAYSLPGDVKLDMRLHDDRRIYQTKDGTTIFSEKIPVGPANVTVGSLIGLDDLGEVPRKNILFWYTTRGLTYDADAMIDEAWEDYLSRENKETFQDHYVSQEILPSAYNDQLIWFTTSLSSSYNDQTGVEERTCEAFYRDSGHRVDPEDLFTCSQEEAVEAMLTASKIRNNQRPELAEAFRMEYLVFAGNRVEIWYPTGSLESSEFTRIISMEARDLTHILQPWAVPLSK